MTAPMPRTLIKKLACKLTDKERSGRGDDLVELLNKRNAAVEERKKASKAHRTALAGIDSKIIAVSKQYETGEEFRDVECIEAKDVGRRLMVTTRKDTGAVVETRPMSDADRQEHLPNMTPIDDKRSGKGAAGKKAEAKNGEAKPQNGKAEKPAASPKKKAPLDKAQDELDGED